MRRLFVSFVLAACRHRAELRYLGGAGLRQRPGDPRHTLDATRQPGANGGRLGFFSDIYYDPIRDEWWAISDRGPGGGVLDYATPCSGSRST
jgi:hypothetical protein